MSPKERERKKRLDDPKKLIQKTKKLNGKRGSGSAITTRNETVMEIVEQLRSWPQNEECKLVREYDQLQSAQAGRGSVLRAPAPVPIAGASELVAGAAPTMTVARGK